MKILTISWFTLVRLFRVRSTIFFVLILPMLLIFLLGTAFGGSSTPKLGVHDASMDDLSSRVVDRLRSDEGIEVVEYDDTDSLLDSVSRGRVSAGIDIPEDFSSTAIESGGAQLSYYGRPDSAAQQLRNNVLAAVAAENVVLRAGLFASQEAGLPLGQALDAAETIQPFVPPVEVETQLVGESDFPEGYDAFDAGASAELLLFIFLTSLTSAIGLIESRRLGVTRRMLSTPTPVPVILFGETLSRYVIALMQGAVILGGSALLFGVTWGDPFAAIVIVLLFALVGTGAGSLLGSLLSNDQSAAGVAVGIGLGFAAIGGSMVPLEIFPDTVRAIAHITPHAWGNDAFTTLLREGGGIGDILPELGILAAYAAGLLAISTVLLQRKITGT